MANKSNTASQTISTPQGGGALHGIGETFSPDLYTGTGHFTVPITIPQGRNEFQPELNLVYSTGNGNGPFGLGWELSVPGVARKTAKGIPRYRSESGPTSERDTFILAGAEDLVPVAGASGVIGYRPRTEGLFARIEHHTTAETDHWEVRTRDGLINVYGTPLAIQDNLGTTANPENESEIFSWKLTKTVDPFGNTIQYEYEKDSGEPPEQWNQIYLKRISYADYKDVDEGGTTNDKFLVSVTFLYEERPDPFSERRAGFEIRTRRRCTKIEVRTDADQERLIRSYELIYLDQLGLSIEELPLNSVSLLSKVIVTGHDDQLQESFPPLEFGYTAFEPRRRRYQPFTGPHGSRPSRSLAHSDYELVDLFGRGLPDVLEFNGQIRYWRNLGNGRFDVMRTMNHGPAAVELSQPGVQLLDANGNGRADLMVVDEFRKGYFPLTFAGEWSQRGFTPYRSAPTINLDAPDVRLIDLDGNGITDALRTGPQFELYYNDAEHGWSELEVRPRINSDSFPNVSFEDKRVKLGDLTGDGLQDIIRIHSGRVEYWPYRGYGRWGQRVVMGHSPRFEDEAFYPGVGYDPKRLLLGDVDGDGVADLIYVSSGHITVWINQGGNAWSDPIVIHGTPRVTDATAVRLEDMMGNGTAGILWTYDLGAFPDSTYKFLDLTGGLKPYVLDRMNNNLGALTKVSYAPSTRYFVEDNERPETRWRTPLPFPVQVVARVEVIDQLSGGKLATEYRYHHGYWDGIEREFRGFAMVEQIDTETFADYHFESAIGSFQPVAERHFSPPLLTKTWFHLGAVTDESGSSHELDLSNDYWRPPFAVSNRVDEFLQTLSNPRDRRDALRALRGTVLRTEILALDGTPRQDRPYTVIEKTYGLREEFASEDRPRIFFPHLLIEQTTQWERGDDAMVQFVFTGEYDRYGQSQTKTTLAVSRGRDYRVPVQVSENYLGTIVETRYAQRDDAGKYIVDRICETRSSEVLNVGTQSIVEIYDGIGAVERKLFEQTVNYYDGEAFVGLPFGQLGERGALVRSESLVLTEELLREAYGDAAPVYLQPEGPTNWPGEYPEEFRNQLPTLAGYTFADGSDHRVRGYFSSTLRVEFDFHHTSLPPRGLPVTTRDAFGNDTSTTYDSYHLLPEKVTDPVGLTTIAKNDYRTFQPQLVTDINANRRAMTFSPLGLVTSVSVRGKENEEVGDTPQVPCQRLEYDFFRFIHTRQPVFVRKIARQHHVNDADVPLPERDETLITVEYSDGFGRLLQTRTQAADVLFGDHVFGGGVLSVDQSAAPQDAVGTLSSETEPNVIVSGWQIYDNKGRVVEKYEPFFDTVWEYEPASDAQKGQKITMFYDPRGQLVRTLNADGSERRVVYGVPPNFNRPDQVAFTPWEAYTYDENDIAPLCEAPDGTPLGGAAPVAHHLTPSNIVIDGFGRTIETVTRNRETPENAGDPLPHMKELRTRSTYDIRGNLLTVTDPLNRPAFSYTYDLANRPWRIRSIDGGQRRIVLNVTGKEIERRDSKEALTLQSYDLLQRPIRFWARDDADGPITLQQRIEYGDGGIPNQIGRDEMQARNLLGQVHRHHDEAGLTSVELVDFKGNLLEKVRRVIADGPILAAVAESQAHGWQIKPFQVNWSAATRQELAALESDLLETTAYRSSSTFDALNRLKKMQMPEDVEGVRHEITPRFTRAGDLDKVFLDDELYVERIAYDAKGQRTLIAFGNGVMTRYAYDAQTFNLRRIRSERYQKPDEFTYRPSGEVLQDLAYDYDLVRNIVAIHDRTPKSGFLNNPEAAVTTDPVLAQLLISGDALNRRFSYDAIYRLLSATGREGDVPPDPSPWSEQPRSTDPTRARAYTERYRYDDVGNVQLLEHRNDAGGFTREFTLATDSNRLRSMKIGSDPFDYTFDANGNMRSETSSRHFEWNHADQMKTFRTQTAGAEPSVYAQYLYDADGQRVKKLVRKQSGMVEVTHYVDDVFEHHRWSSPAQAGENNHVHVMNDKQRIALVRLGPTHPADGGAAVQFHLGDHLGSSSVVIDGSGALTNREEFTPYGETSFGSFAKKRYRFTGMERDEESGLSHHGARYYAPWLLRWLSSDPIGVKGGVNAFLYAAANPLRFVDINGKEADEPWPIDAPGKDKKPSVKIKVIGRSFVDEPVKDANGEQIGNVSLGNGTFKIDPVNVGLEGKVGAVDVEVAPKISDNVSLVVAGKAANVKFAYSKERGASIDASLFEAGVGAKVGPVKAKALFGLSAGFGVEDGRLKLKVVGGIGGEIEIDIKPIINFVGSLRSPQAIVANVQITSPTEIDRRYRVTAQDDPPPPKPTPRKRPPARPKEKPYVYPCQFGPASNAGITNPYLH
ncbi:MAG TPA: SpvB/TcaC N-terminal domain-containing protein [Pyrinomonadaceae bacterium]|nr:SpvB/TcaC N-terminal domain-containing protein [Pyrinomonadaceae bacterium]